MDNVEVEDNEFSSIVETLVNMFGNVLNRDVITAVVENCAGDLNVSAEAIMNMTDGNLSQNTNPDVYPSDTTSNKIDSSSAMDLISFANPDDGDLRTYDTNSADNRSPIATVSGHVENTESNTKENVLDIKSSLDVKADAYIPRSEIVGSNIPTSGTNTISGETLEKMITSESFIPKEKYQASHNNVPEDNTFQSLISYSGFARKTGALPKKVVKSTKPDVGVKLTPQLQHITEYHSQGFRTLIFMRGAPGSGKSYLAQQVIQMTIGDSPDDYKAHILSTDDFFSLRGHYQFNKYFLKDAHAWNHKRAQAAMELGLSPVIIDNTNIEIWEMAPYVRYGVANGYKIEVMEPKTQWSKKPHQLAKKNIHGVPLPSIIRMLDNYTENVTGSDLIKRFKLSYGEGMAPPVLRNKPPITSMRSNNELAIPKGVRMVTTNKRISPVRETQENIIDKISNVQSSVVLSPDVKDENCCDFKVMQNECVISDQFSSNASSKSVYSVNDSVSEEVHHDKIEDCNKLDSYSNIQRQLEDLERLDLEWENNPPWEDNTQNESNSSNIQTEPKPPRNSLQIKSESDKLILHDLNDHRDWKDISMFMQPWSDGTKSMEKELVIPVETKTTGTCVEMGDTDIYNSPKIYKVLSAIPRDINQHHITPYREKIPEKRMLDKSSMTNERLITHITRCKNEERHFNAFRKMFKNISKSGLRDIFDQCRGDVNWAVEIVLDGISNNELSFTDTLDLSDNEDENSDQCTCLAAYNIIPDGQIKLDDEGGDEIAEATTSNAIPQRKAKKEMPLSEMSIQLKRQIEQNVVIHDNHYSQHCLNIRKMRRGESCPTKSEENLKEPENAQALVSLTPNYDKLDESSNADHSDDESNTSVEELEKIVNINVGQEFIRSLDAMFGRRGITYPENVVPKLSIPLSLVNELNALWMESLMHQLDDYDKQSAAMVKQDEEFARQLAAKEMEMEQEGKEPEVPDFKEIMDMDFAMSLYQKDVDDWRNKEPDNWAAKLTRDKLFNLFPSLPQETLSELLVAHDNNFKATVEVLLMSTGKSEILEEKNGLVKFVMSKELERQEKIIEQEKKAISDVDWPLLPQGERADMSTVDKYRKNAERHLARRNKSYNKAQEYIHRGMTQVAVYYSDVAAFHKQMFDQANSLAAATLMQVHALKSPNNATIDLHYLRVAEALESMDIFIDTHINKLRDSTNRGTRQLMLFFITGRGLHSHGGPKVKPAVKKRLRERGIICRERNPGLLCARVSAEDKLSYQLKM